MSSQAAAFADTTYDRAHSSRGAVDTRDSRALIDWQIDLLQELAEIEADVARAIGLQARAAAAPVVADTNPAAWSHGGFSAARPNVCDLGLAATRVSRAMRLTTVLISKLDADRKLMDSEAATEAREAEAAEALARPQRKAERVEQIDGAIWRIADAAHVEGEGDGDFDKTMREARERLSDEEVYGDLLTRPVSEIIAHICRDVGLSPDWAHIAEEAWARAEYASGKVGAPLAAVAGRPGGPEPSRPPATDPPDAVETASPPGASRDPPDPEASAANCNPAIKPLPDPQ